MFTQVFEIVLCDSCPTGDIIISRILLHSTLRDDKMLPMTQCLFEITKQPSMSS